MLEDCFSQDEYIKNTNNDFHTVGVQMNFKSPARLNDQLEVYTGVKKLGNSSMTFIQEIYRVGSDEILNSANTTWVNTNQKSMKTTETLNSNLLKKLKLIDQNSIKLKILGSGAIKDKINIEADLASKSAVEKLEKIGGSIQLKK